MHTNSGNNKKKINWLIVLMTISLMGITAIQAYWLNKSYHLEEEKFDQQVANALQGVAGRLETLETIHFLNDNFKLEPFFSSKANPFIGLQDHADSSMKIETAVGEQNVYISIVGDSVKVREKSVEKTPDAFYNSRDTAYNVYIHDRQRVTGKFQRMDAIFNKLILRTFRSAAGIKERISQRNLDSILDFELKSQGIRLPYEYTVVENDHIVMQSDRWHDDNSLIHQAALFPDDLLHKSTLLVNFPGKTNYLLGSMWMTFAISLLFTLAIIITFAKTISYSLQQKRISDIKTDFINNMTHEFKTPIATINLAIDALRNPKVTGNPDKVKHYGEIIKQENRRMNTQVESVLRMALMDKRELELSFEEISMKDVLKECIEHIRLSLESKNGRLITRFNAGDVDVKADRNHLTNAVINILDNAMKYSIGPPEITVATESTASEFILIISDKGIGMTKDEQRHIFDRFYRVTSGDIHNIKGHGLGLSYSKGILEAHHGHIEVESEKNKGSKFYLYLPLLKQNEV